MKLFIKLLLFALVVFVTNVKVASAAIVFPNTQEAIEYSSFIPKTKKVVFKAVEKDLANCCQNGNDLVNYRDCGLGVGVNAAKGVAAPKGWITQASKKGGGTVFKDPKNPYSIIRQMPGNPKSLNPAQRNPYVKFMKDEKFFDVNGNPLPNGNVPAAHIPLNQFNINNMPKF